MKPATGALSPYSDGGVKCRKAIDREIRRIKVRLYTRQFLLNLSLLSLKVRSASLEITCKSVCFRHNLRYYARVHAF
jgi:hypothetical protein